MPHLTIEYSSNLPGYPEAQALADLNASLCASPEILDESDLKSRFVRTSGSFQIGTQPANRAFVHAQLRLLSGRSPRSQKGPGGAHRRGVAPPHPAPCGRAGTAQRVDRGHGPAELREGTPVSTWESGT